nr:helix-turn-helix transcriptional regulator [Pullulanibacillus pueri]
MIDLFGLNKKRSKLGKWIDRNGFTQEDLIEESKVSRNTISKACSDPDYVPTGTTMKKILKAVRKVDPSAKSTDFWDI